MNEVMSWLPDLSGMSLAEVITTDDPEIEAATQRTVAEMLSTRQPELDTAGGCANS